MLAQGAALNDDNESINFDKYAIASNVQLQDGRNNKFKRTKTMNTKKTMQKTLEEKVDACMMLLRSVVAEQNRWKPVLEWQLNKASQRSRQEKCRGKKNDADMVRREHTIQNNPQHALHHGLFDIGGTNPRVGEAC